MKARKLFPSCDSVENGMSPVFVSLKKNRVIIQLNHKKTGETILDSGIHPNSLTIKNSRVVLFRAIEHTKEFHAIFIRYVKYPRHVKVKRSRT